MAKGDVQLNPGAGGAQVATYNVTRLNPDTGALVTETQQIVSITDSEGRKVELATDENQLRMIALLMRICGALELGSGGVTPAPEIDFDDVAELAEDYPQQ